jgi:Cellulase (glycosyl hydrolase family 5)
MTTAAPAPASALSTYPVTFTTAAGQVIPGELITSMTLPVQDWQLTPGQGGNLYSGTPPGTVTPQWVGSIPNLLNQSVAASWNIATLYLTAPSPFTGTLALNGSLPTGWSYAGTTLSYNGSGVGGPLTISFTPTVAGVAGPVSPSFQVQGIGPAATDTLAPTAVQNVVATGGVGQISVTFDPASDPYVPGFPSSGIGGYLMKVNGAAPIAVPDTAAGGPANAFTYADVGTTGIAGSAVQQPNGTDWVVQAAGGDIYGTADSFGFLYVSPSTDWSQTILCNGITQTGTSQAYAKVGLHGRASLAVGDLAVTWVLQETTGNLQLMARTAVNGATTIIGTYAPPATPFLMKLTYSPETGIWNADATSVGTAFGAPMATTTLAMPAGPVLQGIAVCSHQPGVLALASVQQVNCNDSPAMASSVGGLGNNVSASVSLAVKDAVGNTSAYSTPVTATTTNPSSSFGWTVINNHFVDLQSGQAIAPVGVAVFGLEQVYNGGAVTPPYFAGWPNNTQPPWATLASTWGCKVVRIAVNAARINGQVTTSYDGKYTWDFSGAVQSAYLAFLDAAVAAITAAGMYCIIDMHWTAPGSWTPGGQNCFLDANAITALAALGTRYKNNAAVAIEAFNEPYIESTAYNNGGGDCFSSSVVSSAATAHAVLLNGGAAIAANGWTPANGTNSSGTQSYPGGWACKGFQAAITAIRATGFTGPIILGGEGYSNNPAWILTNAPTDSLNCLAVAIHMYPTNAYTNDVTELTGPSFATSDANIQAIQAKYPVIFTETAPTSSTSSSTVNEQMATGAGLAAGAMAVIPYMNLRGIARTYWALCTAGYDGEHNLITDTSLTPSVWGAAAKADMLANSGVPLPASMAGFTNCTFGSAGGVPVNSTPGGFYPFNFYGGSGVVYTQNADGSCTMTKGTGFNDTICSAQYNAAKPNLWQGMAFDANLYTEADISALGTPEGNPWAYWLSVIERASGGYANAANYLFPGALANSGNQIWVERDITEAYFNGLAGTFKPTDINWYGTGNGSFVQNGQAAGNNYQLALPNGATFNTKVRMGCLQVKAVTSPSGYGYSKYYVNGVQIGVTIQWENYTTAVQNAIQAAGAPAVAPASPYASQGLSPGTAFSVGDLQHPIIIFGCEVSANALTAYTCKVWQLPGVSNLVVA